MEGESFHGRNYLEQGGNKVNVADMVKWCTVFDNL